ncbi:hypothetical protein [Halocynthiibacter styelae]|uniref:Uncharacterized protein n=1 Tax=Halocynthiibacter styelae TaxID=2761955 RepID=A0A8J7IBS8_9RHOB|nr:hypothetical protein [Paenihalocynthiibacter styelae]MBI1492553.1 hypothetical protein [Paenihalocynthiibacter styelae]
MIQAKDIKDADDLKVWLDQFPTEIQEEQDHLRSISVQIAHRAAARVLPLEMNFHSTARKFDSIALSILRCSLISGAVRNVVEGEVTSAATAAVAVVRSDIFSDVASFAALSVVRTTGVGASEAALAAARFSTRNYDKASNEAMFADFRDVDIAARIAYIADAEILDEGGDLTRVPLWHNKRNPVSEDWLTFRNSLHNPARTDETARGVDPEGWDFWIDFYEGQLSGHPLPLDLIKEIAISKDVDWESDAKIINRAIYNIRQRYAQERTFNAEHIAQNPESGKLNVIPDHFLPDLRLSDIQAKMLEAAEAFDGESGANGPYCALTAEVDLIRRAAARKDPRPIGLYDACRRAAKRAMGKAARGECPQDDLVEDFAEQLTETAFDISGFDEDVRSVVAHRAALKLEERAQADPALAAEVLPGAAVEVEAISEGDLQAEFVEDAQIASDPQADAQARGNALYRLASRIFRISKWVALAGAGGIAILSQVPGALRAIELMVASPAFRAGMRYLLSFF